MDRATATKGHVEDTVQVESGPVTLEGNLGIPEGARGVVLFAHGSGSSRHSPRNRLVASRLRAAGLATLDVLTGAGFLEHVEAMALHAARRLEALTERSERVARPRGVGLLPGFDQVDASTCELSSLAACESVARACVERGVLTAAHVPRVRLNPPLIITQDELDVVFNVFEEALA